MRLIVDASVAIKLYAAEPDSALASRWFELNLHFSALDIFLVEVAQALCGISGREG